MTDRKVELEIQNRKVDMALFRAKDQFLEKLWETYDESNFDSKICSRN